MAKCKSAASKELAAAQAAAHTAQRETQRNKLADMGRLIWLAGNASVVLTTNMRAQPEERDYVKLLKRVRSGNATVHDHSIMVERVLSLRDVQDDPETWLYAPLLTATNEMVKQFSTLRLTSVAILRRHVNLGFWKYRRAPWLHGTRKITKITLIYCHHHTP